MASNFHYVCSNLRNDVITMVCVLHYKLVATGIILIFCSSAVCTYATWSKKMLLRNILILLALFIHYIEGFERVIVVTESGVTDLNFDDIRGSCCVHGNCSSPSLYNTMTNLASNVLINVTTDVELSSIIPVVDLANIAITGHNNPTENCNNSGGLHLMSCYNCTIEGITWEGCGVINIRDDHIVDPVLQLINSSIITIQNCSFQQSVGQAVVLSGMSGDKNINYCNFLYNKQ